MSRVHSEERLVVPKSLEGNRPWRLGAIGLMAGRLTDAAARWLLLVLLVRYCSTADVGSWAIATAIAAPVFTLLELRLRWLVAADGVPDANLADFVVLRLATVVVAAAIAAILWVVLPSSRLALITSGVFLAKSIELLSELAKGIAQRHGEVGRVAIGSTLRGVLGLAGVVIALVLQATAISAVCGLAAGWFSVLVLWDIPSAIWFSSARRRRGGNETPGRRQRARELERRQLVSCDARRGARPDVRRCVGLVRWALPLAGSAVLIGFGRGLPKFALMAWHGEELVGVFAALAGLVGAGDIALSSITHAAIGPLGNAARNDLARFRRIVMELIVAALGIGLGGTCTAAVVGKTILGVVYGASYTSYDRPLILFSLAMTFAFVNGVLQVALVALRSARRLPWVISAGVVSGSLAAGALVPAWGLVGAALTTLAMTATNCGLLLLLLGRSLHAASTPLTTDRPRLLRLVLAATPTSSSLEQFTRLQRDRFDITLGSLKVPEAMPPSNVRVFTGNGRLGGFIWKLSRQFSRERFDIVHFHAPHLAPCWLIASWLAFRPAVRRRTVYHIHSCWHCYSRRNRVLCLLACCLASQVVTCSHSSTQSLPRWLRWWIGRKLHTIPNGVDIGRTDGRMIASDRETVPIRNGGRLEAVVVATLRPIKNIETILAAARMLPASICRCTIIGGGTHESHYRSLAGHLGVTDRVRFTGCLPRESVLTLMWQSDVLVAASHGEGLPVSVLEAMSAECLVVCSDIAPHRELDQGRSLFEFFPADDPTALARSIQKLAELEASERRHRARRLRDHCVRSFSVERMLEACEAVYELVRPAPLDHFPDGVDRPSSRGRANRSRRRCVA